MANAPVWNFNELREEILGALENGSGGDARVVEGRAVGVKASPGKGNATKVVVGTAALPPGFSTPPHRHESEEVAIIIAGSGHIEVDGVRHRVEKGSILLAPSGSEHITSSDDDTNLVVLWVYAPPGSEHRWLSDDSGDTANATKD